MDQTSFYIREVLGLDAKEKPLRKEERMKLPLYVSEMYQLGQIELFNREVILAYVREINNVSILQTEKHGQLIGSALNKPVAFVFPELASYNRKRLIEKRINFLVPGKQFFFPEFLLDLRESFAPVSTRTKRHQLLPSSQLLFIYHILHRHNGWQIENHSFKEIAAKLNYTPMAISNAIEDLKYHELITVQGEKEKRICFQLNRSELWYTAERQKLLINPVLKKLYTDQLPAKKYPLLSNASALPEYTDMNPSRQTYYAFDKNDFYELQKNNAFLNLNEYEGTYCIEVWKYDPHVIVNGLPIEMSVVDPLSLYLSLKDIEDERIEMAMEQIKENYIW